MYLPVSAAFHLHTAPLGEEKLRDFVLPSPVVAGNDLQIGVLRGSVFLQAVNQLSLFPG